MKENEYPCRNNIELTGEIRDDIQYIVKDSGRLVQFHIEYIDTDLRAKKINIIPCVAWGSMADDIQQRFKKGDKVYICGKLYSNNYRYPDTPYISYGVQIWLDSCEPIETLNKQIEILNHSVNYNVDNFCSAQEINIGDDDDDLPF